MGYLAVQSHSRCFPENVIPLPRSTDANVFTETPTDFRILNFFPNFSPYRPRITACCALMASLLIVYKTKQVKAENWDVVVKQEERASEGPIAGLEKHLP